MVLPRSPLPVILAFLVGCGPGGGKDGEGSTGDVLSWSDADHDNIIDLDEGYVDPNAASEDTAAVTTSADTDGDGTEDYLDEDSDNDGIPDITEAGDTDIQTLPWDSDNDGIADFRDLDSDGNCILDGEEAGDDLDTDGLLPFSDLDDDGDGILDVIEIGAECARPDHDQDGTADFQDLDSDGDGVGDKWEAGTSPWDTNPRDADGDGTADYLDDDSDGDGMSDAAEAGVNNPATEPADTDGDGIYDFADVDSDGDGITDQEEAGRGLDPYNQDSDGDGYTDGAEDAAGTNPLDSGSVIDGLYVSVPERTNVEQTFEFTLSVERGDVIFLLDTTGSMSTTLNGVSTQFNTILSSLAATLPDAAYGVATHDDYAYGGYGSAGLDKPFWLNQQVTTDTSRVQGILSALRVHSGADTPESSMEALYQTLTGAGYDQDCDGRYDTNTDLVPFLASGSDPFGGAGGQGYSSTVPGTGMGGGVGFRDYSLPVIVYATDAQMRDPETRGGWSGTPGGCPGDAGASDVVAAAAAAGARLIGVSVGGTAPVAQMEALADATNSLADTDGDGRANDRLVFQWSGSSSVLRDTIVHAIEDLVTSVQFNYVTLQVDGDTHGFVIGVDPEEYTLSSEVSGQVLDFTLTFRGAVPAAAEDQVYHLALNVLGDGTVLLDTLDIYVVVPGN